ncbi:diguanylate cyclase domain-containing protein [Mycolicibacterium sp. PDY-3]|uniref:sensor domain-containing diguanylate cyclase n=1 Tax=Mycolicibacterium sp. PDY-3 TaxID=3376069 RepID=UPI00378EE9DE
MSAGIGSAASEERRLRTLHSYAVLDTPAEPAFDDLTELAAELCAAPTALISLVDSDRQWFKSRRGIDAQETPRGESFCVHALASHEVLVIPDASRDPRVADYLCVREEPHYRFYAGAPLIAADGAVLGTLCVVDTKPRDLEATQRRHLAVLAAQVIAQLEIRRQAAALAAVVREMSETKRMLDGVLRHTDVLIYAKDLAGRYVMVNPAIVQATRVTEDMIGRTDHDLFARELADEYRRNDRRIMAAGQRQVFTERIVHEDGTHRSYQSTKFPVYDDAGVVIGMAGVSTDVTDLETARAAHEDAEMRLRTVVEQSPVAISVIAESGVLVYVNPAAVALCGAVRNSDLHGKLALDLVVSDQRDGIAALIASVLAGEPTTKSGRTQLLRLDNRMVPVEFTISRIQYSGVPALQAEVRDITADLSDREHLELAANTDALTQLLNRRAWTLRVQAIVDARSAASQSGVLVIAMIDIDHFKVYNDTYGHPAGDDLLRHIAQVFQANVRPDDVLARWGGEEFVVALPCPTTTDALGVLDRLKTAMPTPQTCSIGYAAWTEHDDLDTCISRADKALYAAKDAGRNCIIGRPAEPES